MYMMNMVERERLYDFMAVNYSLTNNQVLRFWIPFPNATLYMHRVLNADMTHFQNILRTKKFDAIATYNDNDSDPSDSSKLQHAS